MMSLWKSLRDEEGSTLVLTLGYAVIALAAIIVCICATDLHIAQKRLDALADAAALAGASGFTVVVAEGAVSAHLTHTGVREQAELVLSETRVSAGLVSARAVDAATARVTIQRAWHPPLFSPFVPDGVTLRATATSRTAFH